jgi:hypothetical protein
MLYNSATATSRVSVFGELRPLSINGLSSLDLTDTLTATSVHAQNLYTRAQTDALLVASLAGKQDLIGTTLAVGSLTLKGDTGTALLQHASAIHMKIPGGTTYAQFTPSGTILGALQASSLDVSGSMIANNISASSISCTNVTSTIGSFNKFSSERIFDNGDTLYFAYGDDPFAVRLGKDSSRLGINCDNSITSGVAIECVGGARFSGPVTASAISAAGPLSIVAPSTSSNPITAAEIGSSFSFARFSHGHHIDSYSRGSGSGRPLYLNYYANSHVRCGNTDGRVGINCDPLYQLDVVGAGRFSGALTASNFPSSSDARLKRDVQDADPTECLRIIQTVRPRTYARIDMNDAPRSGYIAQELSAQLTGNYRCIIGESHDEQGPLLTVDYSRMTVVLHGALLGLMSKLDAALARIEALENRLT